MIGVITANLVQLRLQTLIDDDRFPVTQTMHNPMADSQQGSRTFTLLKPVKQKISRLFHPTSLHLQMLFLHLLLLLTGTDLER